MANIHPNSIFRWEDAASLEHACWQCPTKANSPRALQTCYGIHSMPCTSYHPTMHAIGAAHRCSGCVTTREIHDARHREIAELVAEYREIESPVPETPTRQIPLLERPANIGAGRPRHERQPFHYNAPDNNDIYDENENIAEHEIDDDMVDAMSISSSAPSFATETPTAPTRKLTKAEIRAQKKAKKSVKSQSKALKNQTRHLASVTSADVDRVSNILHGDDAQNHGSTQDGLAHPLATDRTIEDVIARNLNFVKNIQAHKQYLFKSVATGRKEIKERKKAKKREGRGETSEDMVEMDEVVGAIMVKLGISPAVIAASSGSSAPAGNGGYGGNVGGMVLRSGNPTNGNGRKRAPSLTLCASPAFTLSSAGKGGTNKATLAIAAKLRTAIKTDLEKHENEVHMRYVRAGGFWRYVGKSVFERMTEIARDLDVSTGERWEKKWAREGRQTDENDNDGDGDGDGENVAIGEEAMGEGED